MKDVKQSDRVRMNYIGIRLKNWIKPWKSEQDHVSWPTIDLGASGRQATSANDADKSLSHFFSKD